MSAKRRGLGRREGASVAASAIAVAALVGCGSGQATQSAPSSSHAPAPVSPTSTRTPVPSSPADTARRHALAAYRGMWQDFADAAKTSDWQSPKLGQYATGLALSTMSRGLYADHYNGLVSKGKPALHPRVSSVDPPNTPTTVVVTDCGDDSHWLKYRANNSKPANDGPGGRRLIHATVKKQADSSWKVTDFGVQAVGTC